MNDCGVCNDFVALGEKAFASVLQAHGFRQLTCDSRKEGEYCYALYDNGTFRIKLELDQGAYICYLGSVESPAMWGDEVRGVTLWHQVQNIVAFIENWPLEAPQPAESNAPISAEAFLAQRAAMVAQHYAKLAEVFGPQRRAEWWSAYLADFARRAEHYLRSLGL